MKYALIKDNKVELISYELAEGFIEVADNVFADMVLQPDGSYDYTDEFKAIHQKADTYVEKRQAEYPNHNDCIHALLDGGDTLTDLQTKRTAVKDKYPKE